MTLQPPPPAETAAALATVAPIVEHAARIPWAHLDVGAPVNVVLWIGIGAGLGVWNKRMKHKGNLVGAFAASFVLTLGIVVGIPQWTGYQWDSRGYQAAMGMLLAFTSQNWGPKLMTAIGKLEFTDVIRNVLASWIKPAAPGHRRRDDEP